MSTWYVYFMKSRRNNKEYVGKTQKLPEERVAEHNAGTNQWSKGNGPFNLIYFEKYYCSKDAILRENFYKTGLGRSIKKLIIEYILKFNNTGRSSDG